MAVVDPAFVAVEEAFRDNFASRGEVGAAVCVLVEGRVVVDLAGGPGWHPDTLVNAFSIGKGLTAAVLGHVVETTDLRLDDPVSRWWPELDVGLTVAQLASHQAGLVGVREPLADTAMYDWDGMVRALARTEPWWEPGTAHGYHTNTFGFLVGEVVRRAAGRTVGTILRELAAPLAADVFIGLPDSEHSRVVPFHFPESPAALFGDEDDDHGRMLRATYANPPGFSGSGVVNTPAWRRAEIPSTNSHASARGVARFYAGILHGVLAAETVAALCAVQADGHDLVLDRPSRFGAGFQLPQPERPLGTGPRAFGHFGAGGSLGFADPDAGVAFGYVMDQMGPRWQSPRTRALLDAVITSL